MSLYGREQNRRSPCCHGVCICGREKRGGRSLRASGREQCLSTNHSLRSQAQKSKKKKKKKLEVSLGGGGGGGEWSQGGAACTKTMFSLAVRGCGGGRR